MQGESQPDSDSRPVSNFALQGQHMGWEHIWSSGDIPPRYRSFAEPNANLVTWVTAVPSGSLILDVGCGVGRHVTYLGDRGFRMAGVDVSPSGVSLVQQICAERKIDFDGRVSDITALPWPDMTFDAAFSIATIHHQRRPAIVRSLNEIGRVLKPGAPLLLDFPCTDTQEYQWQRSEVAAGNVLEVEPNTFIDERPQPEDSDGFIPHHFCDEADLRDLLRSFEILQLWADLHETDGLGGPGKNGKWVASVRKSSNL